MKEEFRTLGKITSDTVKFYTPEIEKKTDLEKKEWLCFLFETDPYLASYSINFFLIKEKEKAAHLLEKLIKENESESNKRETLTLLLLVTIYANHLDHAVEISNDFYKNETGVFSYAIQTVIKNFLSYSYYDKIIRFFFVLSQTKLAIRLFSADCFKNLENITIKEEDYPYIQKIAYNLYKIDPVKTLSFLRRICQNLCLTNHQLIEMFCPVSSEHVISTLYHDTEMKERVDLLKDLYFEKEGSSWKGWIKELDFILSETLKCLFSQPIPSNITLVKVQTKGQITLLNAFQKKHKKIYQSYHILKTRAIYQIVLEDLSLLSLYKEELKKCFHNTYFFSKKILKLQQEVLEEAIRTKLIVDVIESLDTCNPYQYNENRIRPVKTFQLEKEKEEELLTFLTQYEIEDLFSIYMNTHLKCCIDLKEILTLAKEKDKTLEKTKETIKQYTFLGTGLYNIKYNYFSIKIISAKVEQLLTSKKEPIITNYYNFEKERVMLLMFQIKDIKGEFELSYDNLIYLSKIENTYLPYNRYYDAYQKAIDNLLATDEALKHYLETPNIYRITDLRKFYLNHTRLLTSITKENMDSILLLFLWDKNSYFRMNHHQKNQINHRNIKTLLSFYQKEFEEEKIILKLKQWGMEQKPLILFYFNSLLKFLLPLHHFLELIDVDQDIRGLLHFSFVGEYKNGYVYPLQYLGNPIPYSHTKDEEVLYQLSGKDKITNLTSYSLEIDEMLELNYALHLFRKNKNFSLIKKDKILDFHLFYHEMHHPNFAKMREYLENYYYALLSLKKKDDFLSFIEAFQNNNIFSSEHTPNFVIQNMIETSKIYIESLYKIKDTILNFNLSIQEAIFIYQNTILKYYIFLGDFIKDYYMKKNKMEVYINLVEYKIKLPFTVKKRKGNTLTCSTKNKGNITLVLEEDEFLSYIKPGDVILVYLLELNFFTETIKGTVRNINRVNLDYLKKQESELNELKHKRSINTKNLGYNLKEVRKNYGSLLYSMKQYLNSMHHKKDAIPLILKDDLLLLNVYNINLFLSLYQKNLGRLNTLSEMKDFLSFLGENNPYKEREKRENIIYSTSPLLTKQQVNLKKNFLNALKRDLQLNIALFIYRNSYFKYVLTLEEVLITFCEATGKRRLSFYQEEAFLIHTVSIKDVRKEENEIYYTGKEEGTLYTFTLRDKKMKQLLFKNDLVKVRILFYQQDKISHFICSVLNIDRKEEKRKRQYVLKIEKLLQMMQATLRSNFGNSAMAIKELEETPKIPLEDFLMTIEEEYTEEFFVLYTRLIEKYINNLDLLERVLIALGPSNVFQEKQATILQMIEKTYDKTALIHLFKESIRNTDCFYSLLSVYSNTFFKMLLSKEELLLEMEKNQNECFQEDRKRPITFIVGEEGDPDTFSLQCCFYPVFLKIKIKGEKKEATYLMLKWQDIHILQDNYVIESEKVEFFDSFADYQKLPLSPFSFDLKKNYYDAMLTITYGQLGDYLTFYLRMLEEMKESATTMIKNAKFSNIFSDVMVQEYNKNEICNIIKRENLAIPKIEMDFFLYRNSIYKVLYPNCFKEFLETAKTVEVVKVIRYGILSLVMDQKTKETFQLYHANLYLKKGQIISFKRLKLDTKNMAYKIDKNMLK